MAKDDVGIETRFLTPRDVGTLLNVSESQVYALMRSGDLPAIKIGGRGVWRVDRRRLETWLDELHDRTAEWVRDNPLADPGKWLIAAEDVRAYRPLGQARSAILESAGVPTQSR
jgi:excisionase family DNA binding protein